VEVNVKAARVVAPRQVEILEIEEPSLDGTLPASIKVRVDRACLCGSDLPWFVLDHGDAYPLPIGESIHECIGTVVESTSKQFAEGDLVIALPDHHGGLREYFCTPEDKAIHVPRGALPLEQLLMAQPLGTVIWACQKLDNLLDLDVVVVGQGPIGLLFTHLMSNMGARTVVAVDRLDYRLRVARTMRATHTINVDHEDPVGAVREITGGKMADVVIEAVGHQTETVGLCIELARRMGTVVAFGSPDIPTYSDFPYLRFFNQNLTLIGSVGAQVVPNYSLARDMILQGRIDIRPLITHHFSFSEIQRAYEIFADRRDGAVKVIVDYNGLP
jgi:threonine dehydrogenase-like Zn-dependent dehydrogenase